MKSGKTRQKFEKKVELRARLSADARYDDEDSQFHSLIVRKVEEEEKLVIDYEI